MNNGGTHCCPATPGDTNGDCQSCGGSGCSSDGHYCCTDKISSSYECGKSTADWYGCHAPDQWKQGIGIYLIETHAYIHQNISFLCH